MILFVKLSQFPLGILVLTTLVGTASATNVYIAQTAAGTGDGSSCANAQAYTFFNTASNWGSSADQIGPGTMAHLCGMITMPLTVQGNGSSGSPITIFFEPGAKISLPTCGGGSCLSTVNRSYIIIRIKRRLREDQGSRRCAGVPRMCRTQIGCAVIVPW